MAFWNAPLDGPSTLRFDYSTIGMEVNIASRLKGSTKVFGVDIVARATTREEAAEFAWLEIDRVLFKNKIFENRTRATAIFAPAGGEEYAAARLFRNSADGTRTLLTAHRAREFKATASTLAETARLAPVRVGAGAKCCQGGVAQSPHL